VHGLLLSGYFRGATLTVKTTVRTSLIGWALVRKVAKAADGTPHAVEFVFRGEVSDAS
jgi:hypothetical protein